MQAMTAWKAAVIAMVVFSLLASGSLVQAARGQRDSLGRDISLALARGIDRVANFFSLNRPWDWANRQLGREDVEPEIVFPPTTLPPHTGTTTTTLPPRVVSVEEPLRVRVFGDSQAADVGTMIKRRTADDPLLTIRVDTKVSTGLARPDYYNWPARIQEALNAEDADVVVIMLGANDDQNLLDIDGQRVATQGDPSWEAEYRRRVAGIMDLLDNRRRKVVWIGQPVVRRPKLNATLTLTNSIVKEEAAIRPWVSFVDTAARLAGPNGEYVDYFTPEGGEPVRCRRSDGIHLTLQCVAIVADDVTAVIRGLFPTVQPTTTLAPTTTVPAPTTTVRTEGA
jgi:hypothetical protein